MSLIGAIWEEVQNNKVSCDVHQPPRRAAPVETGHHLPGVAIEKLHHVGLVRDVKEGEVEEDGVGSGDLDGPVANAAGRIFVREVGGVDHSSGGRVVPTTGTNPDWGQEEMKDSQRWMLSKGGVILK